MNWIWDRWHNRNAPKWESFIVGFVIAAIVVGLLAWGTRTSFGAEPQQNQKICPTNPPPDLVCTPSQFRSYFKAGAYSHAQKSLPYSRAFRRAFIHLVAVHAAAHPKWAPCAGGNYGCVWSNYTAHDSCAVSSLPDTFNADSCRASNGLKSLLASPYWKARSATYNKWTLRIVVCGTIAITAIALRANPAATVGAGGGGCLANRLVP